MYQEWIAWDLEKNSFISPSILFNLLILLQVYISSLALLKMLKHGRAGVPMEVMGLMLGEFVDEYTVRVIDVFAMPQSGTVSHYMEVFPVVTGVSFNLVINNKC